ncbi:hypothetical protein D3C81_1642350 [compost metagenome]
MAVEAFELFENHLLFIFRDPWPAIPHLQTQFAAAPPHAQQHRAFGVAESVSQEVLQNPPQQFDVAVDTQMAAAHPELQTLFLRQCLEFRAERVKQFIDRKRLAVRVDLAVFQTRNIQQIADQVLGRTQ